MATWKQNPDLMARLVEAQNHPKNCNIDILTFAGMCDSREELERHVVRYEKAADTYDPFIRQDKINAKFKRSN